MKDFSEMNVEQLEARQDELLNELLSLHVFLLVSILPLPNANS
jgi:ribosomal protein L29